MGLNVGALNRAHGTAHYPRGYEPAPDAVRQALVEAISLINEADLPYLLMGGVVSATIGRPRYTDDIDLFVSPGHARRVLDTLAAGGFTVEETFPDWLYKAFGHGVLVDVIFRSAGDIYVDEEMLARASVVELDGVSVRVIAREDLLVIKAMAFKETTPHHWWDALSIVATCDIDWDYVLERARHGPRRVLSLLLYAESVDLLVPRYVVEKLYRALHTPDERSDQ